jgi:hypothetical protein
MLRSRARGGRARPPATAAAALADYAADILAHADEGAAAALSDPGVEPESDHARQRCALAAAIDRVLVVRPLREAGFS